jgi:hypothetical protein
MRGPIGVLFILLVLYARSQQLSIDPLTSDPAALHFEPDFAVRNGITRITGQASVKKDGQPIREKGDRTVYHFDTHGHASMIAGSFGRPGSGIDTTSVIYTCDAKGRVTEELRNDASGFFALRDSMDDQGRPMRRTFVRIQNIGSDRYHFVPGIETIISDERFAHMTINDTATRTTWLNDRGLPYREQTFHHDRWGYLRTVNDRNLITGRSGRSSLRYDEKGRLAERIEQSDLSVPNNEKRTWRYDASGNVTLSDQWRDDMLHRHTEYLYEEGTTLLKATISKDMETGIIHIMRYKTERR